MCRIFRHYSKSKLFSSLVNQTTPTPQHWMYCIPRAGDAIHPVLWGGRGLVYETIAVFLKTAFRGPAHHLKITRPFHVPTQKFTALKRKIVIVWLPRNDHPKTMINTESMQRTNQCLSTTDKTYTVYILICNLPARYVN